MQPPPSDASVEAFSPLHIRSLQLVLRALALRQKQFGGGGQTASGRTQATAAVPPHRISLGVTVHRPSASDHCAVVDRAACSPALGT